MVDVVINIEDEDLECPVCLGTIFPPIRPCNNGHMVCPDCYEQFLQMKTRKCPVCRGRIQKERNEQVEMQYINLVVSCRYKDEGCEFKSKGNKVMVHQKQCKYGPHAEGAEEEASAPKPEARAIRREQRQQQHQEEPLICTILGWIIGLSYVGGIVYGTVNKIMRTDTPKGSNPPIM